MAKEAMDIAYEKSSKISRMIVDAVEQHRIKID